MNLNVPIKRALLSVSDKAGLLPLAQALQTLGCELISTGGTRKMLQEAGIETTEISEVTRNPEAFGGRMKTISFQIESALLFDRERDAEEAQSLDIQAIDLVVCNLYPFAEVLKKEADFETLIENIDIGGPTMLRAAAKNFKYVTVLCNPADYAQFLAELQENQGATSYDFRRQMMAKTFNHSADYDALIAQTMDKFVGENSKRLHFKGGKTLRYGENSHQNAWVYEQTEAAFSLAKLPFLHGKELSFNNLLDLQAALEAVSDLEGPACAVVKHNNPCGLAQAPTAAEALAWAWQGDVISAFGSVIAFNVPVDLATVQFFELGHEDRSRRKFVEVLAAPAFSDEALAYLQQHKNLRILLAEPEDCRAAQEARVLGGALLWQDADKTLLQDLKLATENQVWDLEAEADLLAFGLKAVRSLKSNAIALVRRIEGGLQLLGMGTGQPNRLIATHLALEKARENLKREGDEMGLGLAQAVLVSDAFFPFADNVELAATAGIRYILQPGGSMRDKDVIACAEEKGVAMAFSGLRHFKH